MIEDNLRTYILADSNISNLVAARIYPLKLPQRPTVPAVTYQRISGERMHSMSGATGLAGPRIQFDCWDTTYLSSKNLADLLRKRIDGFAGTVDSEVIEGIFMDTEREFFEDGDLLKLYRISMDFFVFYTELTS